MKKIDLYSASLYFNREYSG